MLFSDLLCEIRGKYVKTFYVEDSLEYGRVFVEALKLLENNYALRLDFTLSNNKKFSLLITKNYKAILISQFLNISNIVLDLNAVSSYMPLIIDVFTLTNNDYLANIEALNYVQRIYSVNVVSLAPYEIENYRRNILRNIGKFKGIKETKKEYTISSELTRILYDVVGLSKIILYHSSICDKSLQLSVEKRESIKDVVNKIIRNIDISYVGEKDILVYVHVKLRKYVVRMLISVREKRYGITVSIGNKLIIKELPEEPIGKYFEGEHIKLEVKLKCLPMDFIRSLVV